MYTQDRIDLAHGISNAMKRFRGRGIDIEAMLTREDYARDILQQCRASGDAALRTLAADFVAASCSPAVRPAAPRVVEAARRPDAHAALQRNRSWLAPLDVFSRRSSVPRG